MGVPEEGDQGVRHGKAEKNASAVFMLGNGFTHQEILRAQERGLVFAKQFP